MEAQQTWSTITVVVTVGFASTKRNRRRAIVDIIEVVVRNKSTVVFSFIHDGPRTTGNDIRPLTVSLEAGKAEAILGQSLDDNIMQRERTY